LRRTTYCANRLQAEDKDQGLVDRAEFACVQPTSRPAEPLWIDDCGLLDENTRLVPVECYRPPASAALAQSASGGAIISPRLAPRRAAA
jgi:hypothetical protein